MDTLDRIHFTLNNTYLSYAENTAHSTCCFVGPGSGVCMDETMVPFLDLDISCSPVCLWQLLLANSEGLNKFQGGQVFCQRKTDCIEGRTIQGRLIPTSANFKIFP